MQVRKLIRLLNELVKENPRLAYAEACIDTELGKCRAPHFKYYSIPDVKTRETVWNAEESENENWRTIGVLGNY